MDTLKDLFFFNEKNETIKVISVKETVLITINKDLNTFKIPISKLKRIKLGEKPIKGLLIEKDPEHKIKNINKWEDFVNESKAIKCSNSSNYLCYISDKFQNDNKIFYVDELQEYLLKEGLGSIIFEK